MCSTNSCRVTLADRSSGLVLEDLYLRISRNRLETQVKLSGALIAALHATGFVECDNCGDFFDHEPLEGGRELPGYQYCSQTCLDDARAKG